MHRRAGGVDDASHSPSSGRPAACDARAAKLISTTPFAARPATDTSRAGVGRGDPRNTHASATALVGAQPMDASAMATRMLVVAKRRNRTTEGRSMEQEQQGSGR